LPLKPLPLQQTGKTELPLKPLPLQQTGKTELPLKPGYKQVEELRTRYKKKTVM